MALRKDLEELRSRNRDELGKISTSVTIIGMMVAIVLFILAFILWGELVVGDDEWVDRQFWWIFFGVIIIIGWSLVGIHDFVHGRFKRHVLKLRKELERGLWFFIADDSAWDLLRDRQARQPLLRPLQAPRPDNVVEQVRVAATYHRSLIAISRGRDPGSGAWTDMPACTLLFDRIDNSCCSEDFTLVCMTCGGLGPAFILWPLAIWPLLRYIEYKAAVDEFSRFLLADGTDGIRGGGDHSGEDAGPEDGGGDGGD